MEEEQKYKAVLKHSYEGLGSKDMLLNAAYIIAQVFEHFELNEEEKRRVMEFMTKKQSLPPAT